MRIPAASSARAAACPSSNRKCATPRLPVTKAPPPSMLMPAAPSVSPIRASSPGVSSRSISTSNTAHHLHYGLMLDANTARVGDEAALGGFIVQFHCQGFVRALLDGDDRMECHLFERARSSRQAKDATRVILVRDHVHAAARAQ